LPICRIPPEAPPEPLPNSTQTLRFPLSLLKTLQVSVKASVAATSPLYIVEKARMDYVGEVDEQAEAAIIQALAGSRPTTPSSARKAAYSRARRETVGIPG